MTILPEVADRLIEKADLWMVSNDLPESMRFIIERAMFFGAGVVSQKNGEGANL